MDTLIRVKMNNNFEFEEYCSFEESQLLKEKGFDMICRSCYEFALTSKIDAETNDYSGEFGWKAGELNIQHYNNRNSILPNGPNWFCCSRPTRSVAIEWILRNFDIHIHAKRVYMRQVELESPLVKWIGAIDNLNGTGIAYADSLEELFDMPSKAIKAAIIHALNKLV